MNRAGPFGQILHHFLLDFSGLGSDGVIFYLRRRQVELVGGLDVGHLFEHIHQLRQVKEPGKPGPRPVAGALRGQFQGGDGLAKPGSPAVEVPHAHLLETVILEIPLDGIHLRH